VDIIIAPVIIEDTSYLEQLEGLTQLEKPLDEQLNAPENTRDNTELEVEVPMDSKENS